MGYSHYVLVSVHGLIGMKMSKYVATKPHVLVVPGIEMFRRQKNQSLFITVVYPKVNNDTTLNS